MKDFTSEEEDLIFKLAHDLTGSVQEGDSRKTILLTNIQSRMYQTKSDSLVDYLNYVRRNPHEKSNLISALTIHTTYWFRESRHLKHIELWLFQKHIRNLKVLVVGCSSGQTSYSLAMFFEDLRKQKILKDWSIRGVDIDPVSVAKAQRAIYPERELKKIPEKYRGFILRGSGKTAGLFTLDRTIRKSCHFDSEDIRTLSEKNKEASYDLIICRNVFIYFDQNQIKGFTRKFERMLGPEGLLVIGHSEYFDHQKSGFVKTGSGVFVKTARLKMLMKPTEEREIKGGQAKQRSIDSENRGNKEQAQKKILVIDDSNTILRVLRSMFEGAGYRVCTASSGREADQILAKESFDLITLDLHMPEQDGPSWLHAYRKLDHKTPVFIISGANPDEANAVLGALESGAQEYIDKNILGRSQSELVEKIEEYLTPKQTILLEGQNLHTPKNPDLLLVGASTGGTVALEKLLNNFPRHGPPVVVVQHINHAFSRAFAEKLSLSSKLKLEDPKRAGKLKRGHLYLALDDYHIGISRKGRIKVSDQSAVSSHRPSVDFLFESAANSNHQHIMAVILTGMGKDGAKGMKKLFDHGSFTMAQSAESCAIFGMPKAAIELGGVDYVGDLNQIRNTLLQNIVEHSNAA